ncbi:MAG: PhzF family phenazine biosynthesis protein [Ignavibacteria bacterium]
MTKIFTVDSFTDKPFAGNPAGVCLLDKNKDDGWLLNVAAEMNLSETAFVKKETGAFSLRWFTPKVEVELCGHATLASAHILWQEGILKPGEEAVFNTVFSGKLTAKKEGDEITLNFPLIPVKDSHSTPELESALGDKPVYVGDCGVGEYNYLIEFESEDQIINLKPDFSLLAKIPKFGFIVTAKAENKNYDFVSRYFAPAKGINEDPVTGSAHCSLAPYWSGKLNKNEMNAYQASHRGGYLKVRIENDRVLLIGKAVTVLESNLIF